MHLASSHPASTFAPALAHDPAGRLRAVRCVVCAVPVDGDASRITLECDRPSPTCLARATRGNGKFAISRREIFSLEMSPQC